MKRLVAVQGIARLRRSNPLPIAELKRYKVAVQGIARLCRFNSLGRHWEKTGGGAGNCPASPVQSPPIAELKRYKVAVQGIAR
ncbi:MAG: hypothetical protein ACM31N_09010 [Deltaproteobacteria bacterium]